MVIENILRGLEAGGVTYEASYYRTGGGAEIDLVLEGDFGLIPIEIKRTQSIDSRDLRALTDFLREWKCPCGVVINNDEVCRRLSDNIVSIPFACL